MEQPLLGELTGGDHEQRVIALAGALAESSITQIMLESNDGGLTEIEARTTDLPGLLANPQLPFALHLRARTLISIGPASINWVTFDAALDEALRRAKASLR